jgi:hypothetical protein
MYQKEGNSKKGVSGEKKINTKIVGRHNRYEGGEMKINKIKSVMAGWKEKNKK